MNCIFCNKHINVSYSKTWVDCINCNNLNIDINYLRMIQNNLWEKTNNICYIIIVYDQFDTDNSIICIDILTPNNCVVNITHRKVDILKNKGGFHFQDLNINNLLELKNKHIKYINIL